MIVSSRLPRRIVWPLRELTAGADAGSGILEVVLRPGIDRAEVVRAPFIPALAGAWVLIEAVHVLGPKPGA